MPDFRALSVWVNAAIFVGAAAVVWLAGTRLAYYADAISERTKPSMATHGLRLGCGAGCGTGIVGLYFMP